MKAQMNSTRKAPSAFKVTSLKALATLAFGNYEISSHLKSKAREMRPEDLFAELSGILFRLTVFALGFTLLLSFLGLPKLLLAFLLGSFLMPGLACALLLVVSSALQDSKERETYRAANPLTESLRLSDSLLGTFKK